uniref:Uncharacterized protein n=1 Tax=Brassica oleracea var. oleracea TaxID=109376 RepID=A0A0D3BGE9_BRAOL
MMTIAMMMEKETFQYPTKVSSSQKMKKKMTRLKMVMLTRRIRKHMRATLLQWRRKLTMRISGPTMR